jgi:putative addiction module killer protein
MHEVREYLRDDGTSPFRTWFLALGTRARESVDDAVARMRLGNLGDHKTLGGGLIERRVHFGPGYRVYFGREGDRLILLLAGGTKRRQQRDIDEARKRWNHYKRRKRRGD